jgi:hypothetical protein
MLNPYVVAYRDIQMSADRRLCPLLEWKPFLKCPMTVSQCSSPLLQVQHFETILLRLHLLLVHNSWMWQPALVGNCSEVPIRET